MCWYRTPANMFFLILRSLQFSTHSHLKLQPKGPGLGHTHDSHSALPWGSNALRHMWYIIRFTQWSFGSWFMVNFRVQSPSVQIRLVDSKCEKSYKTPRCGMVFGMSGCTTQASQTSCLLYKPFSFNETHSILCCIHFKHTWPKLKVFLAKLGPMRFTKVHTLLDIIGI